MKLTILGNNGPFPSAGGACSGYLIEDGDKKILLDCGNGVLSNLQKFCRLEDLDAIILSHLHSDHMSDMMVLRYAVQIKMNKGQFPGPIKVYLPPEPAEEFTRLNIPGTFNVTPISPELNVRIGQLAVTFKEMKHPIMSYGVCLQNESKRFVYSGDTSWCQSIIDFSKGAEFLLCDAGLLSRDKTGDNVAHLTAREVGIVAREAGVKRLMLTHFWPEHNTEEHIAEAGENFAKVEIARILEQIDI